MKRSLLCLLALLGLVVSLLPARKVPSMVTRPMPESEPALLRCFEYAYHFLMQVNLWPFVFLQLLLSAAIPCFLGWLLLPGLAAGGLAAGFLYVIFCLDHAGGILVIILTVITFGIPLIGSLLGTAVWAVLRLLKLCI